MNTLDYAIVGVTVFGALYGVSRGVLRMATSLASLVAGIYCAAQYHSTGGAMVERALGPSAGSTVIAVLGYIAVFAIVFAGVEAAGNILIRLLQIVHLNWADRLSGGLVGAAVAAVMAGFGMVMLTTFLPSDSMLMRESKLAPHVMAYNQALMAYVPAEIRDAYQVRRDALVRYWLEHSPGAGSPASAAPAPGVAAK